MPKGVRISLANKCQLLFGLAVVLILCAALSVGAVRMQTLVHEGQQDAGRKLAKAWLAAMLVQDKPVWPSGPTGQQGVSSGEAALFSLVDRADFEKARQKDAFLDQAIERFETHPYPREWFKLVRDFPQEDYYRYATAVRRSDLLRERNRSGAGAGAPGSATHPHTEMPASSDPLEKVLLIRFGAELAQQQLLLNRVYLVAAGLFAGLLAIGTFWYITTRIILSPVRVLRDTAAKVAEGGLNIRSEISTGDEYEELSDAFNTMLENLKKNQEQLQSINKSLDLKLGELAQTNVNLYEANKVKGEFLANVSHELRTPLNSIIGFAEVLGESLKSGDSGDSATDEKRLRYVANIITSSRRLLDLINDLLDLAKIEAGRMEVRVSSLSIADSVEGLMALMKPQAEKNSIVLKLKIEPDIPVIQTDAGKLQQILFNFLSNAIKFTPSGGTVTLSAKLLPSPRAADPSKMLCVSVADTGPGIPIEKHEVIFEKFTQLDSTVTRAHSGTGLGLTISRDLATLLRGRIELDSDTGKGATFSLIIPLSLEPRSMPLMPDLADSMPASAG